MNTRTLVIAEAGINHNGSMEIAKKLIEVASKSGADFVKFQTFNPEQLVTKSANKANYQNNSSDLSKTQYDLLKSFALTRDQHFELREHCKIHKIGFFSTAFDLESLTFLDTLDFEYLKIPSGEITNYPYLRMAARMKKRILLSTGMSKLEEIESAIKILEKEGTSRNKVIVLQCNTAYPTPPQDVNLRAMLTIGRELGVKVGYSDHTLGIEMPIAAVALGACVIEKHFTLDRNLPGPDHKASLEPDELESMIRALRNVEMALGDGIKSVSKSEYENIAVARKSIVASRRILKGEVFSEENLTTKRPGTGLSPMRWEEMIGKIAIREFEQDSIIDL